MQYGAFKLAVADAVVEGLAPIRAAYLALDDEEVARLMAKGALEARIRAEHEMVVVRNRVGSERIGRWIPALPPLHPGSSAAASARRADPLAALAFRRGLARRPVRFDRRVAVHQYSPWTTVQIRACS